LLRITLFDDPEDDIFDGEIGEDDEDWPRVLMSFTVTTLETQSIIQEAETEKIENPINDSKANDSKEAKLPKETSIDTSIENVPREAYSSPTFSKDTKESAYIKIIEASRSEQKKSFDGTSENSPSNKLNNTSFSLGKSELREEQLEDIGELSTPIQQDKYNSANRVERFTGGTYTSSACSSREDTERSVRILKK